MKEELKSYIWGGISFTITLVLLYLVGPLQAEVNSNRMEIQEMEVKNAVLETTIEQSLKRIEERLERVETMLKEMN
tara:strand:- start:3632 stop:3859 length:228 start_codon:yes stop_codon:yes gene_type:complete